MRSDDLVDKGAGKRAKAEHAMDKLRAKFGGEAVGKGRSLGRAKHDQQSPNRRGT